MEYRINLISEFIEENFTSKGMIADCNIHNPKASDNEEQPHAHILLTLREIDSEGNWKAKSKKEYILDESGEKIKLKSGNYISRKLNPYASNKKIGADLRRFSKARIYLSDNNLKTIEDLQEKISKLQAENKKINQEVKAKTTRIENLNKCFAYTDIIKDNKSTYDEWNNKSLFKDSFYNSHKEEIDKYRRARRMIEQFTGTSALKPKEWQKEIKNLESEIEKLNRQSQAIKDEYESINHIKYAVK